MVDELEDVGDGFLGCIELYRGRGRDVPFILMYKRTTTLGLDLPGSPSVGGRNH